MSKATVKIGARGGGRRVRPGRGAWKGGLFGEPALRRAHDLLDRLSHVDLLAAVPVLEKYAPPNRSGAPMGAERTGESHPPVPFSVFADYIETLDSMIADAAFYDVESCDASDLGTFIHNVGTAAERAEALLALMPVATRVFLRCDAANDARREAMHAASDKRRAATAAAIEKHCPGSVAVVNGKKK